MDSGALCLLSSIYAVYVINTASAFAVYDDHLKAEGLISAALELTAYQQQRVSPVAPDTWRIRLSHGSSKG
jgi:hypothetical protein